MASEELKSHLSPEDEEKNRGLKDRYRRLRGVSGENPLAEATGAEINDAGLENFRREAIGRKIPITPENLNRIISISFQGNECRMATIDNDVKILFTDRGPNIEKRERNKKDAQWIQMKDFAANEFLKQFPVKSLFEAFEKAGTMYQAKINEDAAKKMVSEI
ncbi:MAG: hypothetical protein Q7S01_02610 [bacterium]|nr:hypothetical protein [bacterium]